MTTPNDPNLDSSELIEELAMVDAVVPTSDEVSPIESETVEVETQEVTDPENDQSNEPIAHPHVRPKTSPTVTIEVNPISPAQKTQPVVSAMPDARIRDMEPFAQLMDNLTIQEGEREGQFDLDKMPQARESLMLGGLGTTMLFQEGEHDAAIDREGSDWKQYVSHGQRKYRPTTPNLTPAAEGAVLKDQLFMQHFRNALGHGNHLLIPLWNSGFWLDLRAIPDHERNLMLERMVSEKFSLGRSTGGLIYGTNEVHFYRHILDLILTHGVVRSTIEGVPVVDLGDYILVSDIQYIAAGLAHLMYPSGYAYARACTANPETCHHVVTERVDLSSTFLVDTSRLTEKQVQHMAKARGKPVSIDEVLEYQTTVRDASNYTQDINEVVRLHYKVPTLNAYIQAGSQWVAEMEGHVDAAFQGALSRQKRESILRAQIANTTLRMWAHWFSKIEVGQNYADSPDDLQNALVEMSQDDALVEKVIEAMRNVMINRTYSLIGIPAYECPNCQGIQMDKDSTHPYVIPLNAVQTFFILSDAHPSYRSTATTGH